MFGAIDATRSLWHTNSIAALKFSSSSWQKAILRLIYTQVVSSIYSYIYFLSPKTASEACCKKDLSPDLVLSPTALSTVSVTLSLPNSKVDFWESGLTAEEILSEISLRPASDIVNLLFLMSETEGNPSPLYTFRVPSCCLPIHLGLWPLCRHSPYDSPRLLALACVVPVSFATPNQRDNFCI